MQSPSMGNFSRFGLAFKFPVRLLNRWKFQRCAVGWCRVRQSDKQGMGKLAGITDGITEETAGFIESECLAKFTPTQIHQINNRRVNPYKAIRMTRVSSDKGVIPIERK